MSISISQLPVFLFLHSDRAFTLNTFPPPEEPYTYSCLLPRLPTVFLWTDAFSKMSPHVVVMVLVLFLFLNSSPSVLAEPSSSYVGQRVWSAGSSAESCDQTCARLGRTCDDIGFTLVTPNEAKELFATLLPGKCKCLVTASIEQSYAPYFGGTGATSCTDPSVSHTETCVYAPKANPTKASTCAVSYADASDGVSCAWCQRLCPCLPVPCPALKYGMSANIISASCTFGVPTVVTGMVVAANDEKTPLIVRGNPHAVEKPELDRAGVGWKNIEIS